MHHTKATTIGLLAAIGFGLATSAASARNLSISSQNFLLTWDPITFSSGGGGEGITIRCRLTLEGSFHYRTIAKVLRSLIGYVTSANFRRPCTGGEFFATTRAEGRSESLPWHITYEGFEGRLPAIEGTRLLLRPLYSVSTALTGECRYQGNAQFVAKLTRGVVTSLVPDNTIGLTRQSGGVFCPASHFFTAPPEVSRISQLPSWIPITVTLI